MIDLFKASVNLFTGSIIDEAILAAINPPDTAPAPMPGIIPGGVPLINLGATFQFNSSSIPPYCFAAFLFTTNSPGSRRAGTLSPSPFPGTQAEVFIPSCARIIPPV